MKLSAIRGHGKNVETLPAPQPRSEGRRHRGTNAGVLQILRNPNAGELRHVSSTGVHVTKPKKLALASCNVPLVRFEIASDLGKADGTKPLLETERAPGLRWRRLVRSDG